jgi:leucine dehydrogenase
MLPAIAMNLLVLIFFVECSERKVGICSRQRLFLTQTAKKTPVSSSKSNGIRLFFQLAFQVGKAMDWIRETINVDGYENVVYGEHTPSGMRSIVAIHNTNRGPACGGIRMLPYSSREEALEDVLRLAQGMSYKSALAGIGFGGGKSVILGAPAKKTPALLHAFGEFVDSFKGRYICAKDMNIDTADLGEVWKKTKHVLGADGQPGSGGDPSPLTAIGVFRSMEATAESVFGSKNLAGLRVTLQGLGHVGYDLAQRLHKAGAKLWVTDIDPKAIQRAVEKLGAQAVGLEEIYGIECDIYSPSARGATLNAQTIPRLKCRAVVGCANNQLETEQDGFRLVERGILYAPDFVVNSGGIINVFCEYEGYNAARAHRLAEAIYGTTREILQRSKQSGRPPFLVAEEVANERLKNPALP